MAAANSFAMILWQTTLDPGTARDIHWIMVAEIAIAAILVVVLLSALIGGLVVWSKINGLIEEAKQKANPLIAKGTDLFDHLAPKVRSITENVEQISFTARAKVDEVGETVSQINKTVGEVNRTVADINGKTRIQADRVHGLVTEALTTTQEVSRKVQHGVMAPVRQAAGVVAGVKAALETLVARSSFGPSSQGPSSQAPSSQAQSSQTPKPPASRISRSTSPYDL